MNTTNTTQLPLTFVLKAKEEQPKQEEKVKHIKNTDTVPWSECLPLIEKIERFTGWGHAQILKTAGYSSESSITKWTEAGEAAVRFKMALNGVMYQLGIIAPSFDFDELTLIFSILTNHTIPTDDRRRLVAKVAKELSMMINND